MTNRHQEAANATVAPAETSSRSTVGWRGLLDDRSPQSLACLVAFAIAGAYLVVLSLRLPEIVTSLTWNSDVASAFTIPESLIATGTGGHTVLGSAGEYVSLWFGLLTAFLPLHRELWEYAPATVFLIAALTIGWCVSQVASRREAVLAVLLALVAAPPAIRTFMSANTHNSAYLGTALLGAYVVWTTRPHSNMRLHVGTFVLPALAGALLGVFLASNLLLLVTGVVPFAFTAALAGLQRNRQLRLLALSAFTTLALAVAVALLTSHIMGSLGFEVQRPSTNTVSLSALPVHSEYLFESLKALFGGDQAGTGAVALGMAADVVMAAALLMLLIVGGYTVVRLGRSSWRKSDEHVAPRNWTTRLHIVYWTSSAISAVVAFELSIKGISVFPQYLATVIFSVAAVAPVLMRRTSIAAWLVPAGASVLFSASLVGLTGTAFGPNLVGLPTTEYNTALFAKDESAITRLAGAYHATKGYAGYSFAAAVTWNSRERVKVRPVALCTQFSKGVTSFCPYYVERVASWYVPANRRTFVLLNPYDQWMDYLPPILGQPLAVYRFNDATVMFIYPYDIASRFGNTAV